MTCVVLTFRFLLGFSLLRTGLAKLFMDPDPRRASISRYRLLPGRIVPWAATALVAAELGVSTSLLLGVAVRASAIASGLLFATFSCAIATNLLRGRSFECGCGASERLISWKLAGQDLLLGSASGLVAGFPTGVLAAWPGWGAPQSHQASTQLLPVPMLTLLLLVLGVVGVRGRKLGLLIASTAPKPATR